MQRRFHNLQTLEINFARALAKSPDIIVTKDTQLSDDLYLECFHECKQFFQANNFHISENGYLQLKEVFVCEVVFPF